MVVYTCVYFFFNDTATTEIYTLSLHDALRSPPPGPAPAPARDDAPESAITIATTPACAPACAIAPGRGPWAPCPAPISVAWRGPIPTSRAAGRWRTVRPLLAARCPTALR